MLRLILNSKNITVNESDKILSHSEAPNTIEENNPNEPVCVKMAVYNPQDILLHKLIESGIIDLDWNFISKESAIDIQSDSEKEKELFDIFVSLNNSELKYSFLEFAKLCCNAASEHSDIEHFFLHGSFALALLGLNRIKNKLLEKFPQYCAIINQITPKALTYSDIDLRLNVPSNVKHSSFTYLLNREILYDLLDRDIECTLTSIIDDEPRKLKYSISEFSEVLQNTSDHNNAVEFLCKNNKLYSFKEKPCNLKDLLECLKHNNYSPRALKDYLFLNHIQDVPNFLWFNLKNTEDLDIEFNEFLTNSIPVDFTLRRKSPPDVVRITQQKIHADLLPAIRENKSIVLTATDENLLHTYCGIGSWTKLENNNQYDWCAYILMLTRGIRFPNDKAEKMLTQICLDNIDNNFFLIQNLLMTFNKVNKLSDNFKAIYILNALEILRPSLQNQKILIMGLLKLSPLLHKLISPISRKNLSYNTLSALIQFISYRAMHLPPELYERLPFEVDVIQHKGTPHLRFTIDGISWITNFDLNEAWGEIVNASLNFKSDVLQEIYDTFCGKNIFEFTANLPFASKENNNSIYPGLNFDLITQHLSSHIPLLRNIAFHQIFTYILSFPGERNLDHLYILLSNLKQNSLQDICSDEFLFTLLLTYQEKFQGDSALRYTKSIENYFKCSNKIWKRLGEELIFIPHEKIMILGIDTVSNNIDNAFEAVHYQIDNRKIKNSLLILQHIAKLRLGSENAWKISLNKILTVLINTKSTANTFQMKQNATKLLDPLLNFALDYFNPDLSFLKNWDKVITLFKEMGLVESAEKLAEFHKNKERLNKEEFLQRKIESFTQNPTFDAGCNLLKISEEFLSVLEITFVEFFQKTETKSIELNLRFLFESKVQRLLSNENFERSLQSVLKTIIALKDRGIETQKKHLYQIFNILATAQPTPQSNIVISKLTENLSEFILTVFKKEDPDLNWNGIIHICNEAGLRESADRLKDLRAKCKELNLKTKISNFVQTPNYKLAQDLLNEGAESGRLLEEEFIQFFKNNPQNHLEVKLLLCVDPKFRQLFTNHPFELVLDITIEELSKRCSESLEKANAVINQSLNLLISLESSETSDFIKRHILEKMAPSILGALNRCSLDLNFIENWSEVIRLFEEAGLNKVAEKLAETQRNWAQKLKEDYFRKNIAAFKQNPTIDAVSDLLDQGEEFSALLAEEFINFIHNATKNARPIILNILSNQKFIKLIENQELQDRIRRMFQEKLEDIFALYSQGYMEAVLRVIKNPLYSNSSSQIAFLEFCASKLGHTAGELALSVLQNITNTSNQEKFILALATLRILLKTPSSDHQRIEKLSEELLAVINENTTIPQELYIETYRALLKRAMKDKVLGNMYHLIRTWKKSIQNLKLTEPSQNLFSETHRSLIKIMSDLNINDADEFGVMVDAVIANKWNSPHSYKIFESELLVKYTSGQLNETQTATLISALLEQAEKNTNYQQTLDLIYSESNEDLKRKFFDLFVKVLQDSIQRKMQLFFPDCIIQHILSNMNNGNIMNDELNLIGKILSHQKTLKFSNREIQNKFLINYIKLIFIKLDQDNLLFQRYSKIDCSMFLKKSDQEQRLWISDFQNNELNYIESKFTIPNDITDEQRVLIIESLYEIKNASHELNLIRNCIINKYCMELAKNKKIEVINLIYKFLFFNQQSCHNPFFNLFLNISKQYNYELVTNTPKLTRALQLSNDSISNIHFMIFAKKIVIPKKSSEQYRKYLVSALNDFFKNMSENISELTPPLWLLRKLNRHCESNLAIESNELLLLRSQYYAQAISTSHFNPTEIAEMVESLLNSNVLQTPKDFKRHLKSIDKLSNFMFQFNDFITLIISKLDHSPISLNIQILYLNRLKAALGDNEFEVTGSSNPKSITRRNLYKENIEQFNTIFRKFQESFLKIKDNPNTDPIIQIEFCRSVLGFNKIAPEVFPDLTNFIFSNESNSFWWNFSETNFNFATKLKDMNHKQEACLASLKGIEYWYLFQLQSENLNKEKPDLIKLSNFKINLIINFQTLIDSIQDLRKIYQILFFTYPERILRLYPNWDYLPILKQLIEKLFTINQDYALYIVTDIRNGFAIFRNHPAIAEGLNIHVRQIALKLQQEAIAEANKQAQPVPVVTEASAKIKPISKPIEKDQPVAAESESSAAQEAIVKDNIQTQPVAAETEFNLSIFDSGLIPQ